MLLAGMVLVLAAAMTVAWRAGGSVASAGSDLHAQASPLDPFLAQDLQLPGRLVYPYSVVPGGVATPQDAADAARRDPVVGRHYAGFDLRRARVTTLRQARLAYVSYRLKDKIFFTKKKVRLFAGEQVITDGKTTIRGRCGNKVEERPQAQISSEEPSGEVLNAPALTAPGPEKEAALSAPGLTPEKEAAEVPLAAVVTPPGFAPPGMPPTGPTGAFLAPPPPLGAVIGGTGGAISGPGGTTPGTPPPSPPLTPSNPPADPGPVPPAPPVIPPVTPPTNPPLAPPTNPPVTPPGPPVNPPLIPPGPPPGGGPPPPGPEGPLQPPALPPGLVPPPIIPLPPGVTPPQPEGPLGGPPGELLPPPGGTPPPEIGFPPPPAEGPPSIPEPPPVPEPSAYLLVGTGLLAAAWARRRFR